jgi:hypothetical protein
MIMTVDSRTKMGDDFDVAKRDLILTAMETNRAIFNSYHGAWPVRTKLP